jgi:hypothetical protein
MLSIEERLLALEQSSHHATIGGIVMLTGLVLSIVGSMLWAAPIFTRKHTDVFDWVSPPLLDLGMADSREESRLQFLGSLGILIIAIGFVCQAIGAVWTLTDSIEILVIASLVMVSFVGGTTYLLLTLDRTQSAAKKIAVIGRNIRRLLLIPLNAASAEGHVPYCELCLEPMELSDVRVQWMEEPNTIQFPFLQQPYEYHFGHTLCLENEPRKVRSVEAVRRSRGHSGFEVKQATVDDFLSWVTTKSTWYVGFHEHWTKTRGQPSTTTAQEARMTWVAAALRKMSANV